MNKISKGFLWSAVDYFSVQIVQFILSIIIARLVSPSAYGIVVMVQVFMSFAQLFIEGGFITALIQKKDRTDIDYYTVYIFNMILSIVLYGLMFLTAPYIASFYNEPQLTSLTRVIALNLIFSSLSITQMVRLQADLNFKIQAKARLIATFISGIVGVICAYKGMEVWALVIQGVLNTLLTSLLLMSFSRWVPKWIFSIASFRQLFSFGSKVLFSNFLTTCYIQFTNLVIGKFYSSQDLAYYNRGFNISQLPSTSIMEIMNRTIFPVFSSLQDNKIALLESYKKYQRLSCIVIFPTMVILSVLSHPFIIVLLTEKWENTSLLLSIFCMVFIFYPFMSNSVNVTMALGCGNLITKSTLLRRLLGVIILLVTLSISVKAVAIGLVINNFIESFICMWFCKKCSGESVLNQFAYVKDIALISFLTGLVTYLVMIVFNNCYLQLFVGSFVGVFFYIFCIYVLKLNEREYINNFLEKIKKYLIS